MIAAVQIPDWVIAWLIGVGIVIVVAVILLGIAEVLVVLDEGEDRRTAEYIRNPALPSEAEARLRNELARHHDGIDP